MHEFWDKRIFPFPKKRASQGLTVLQILIVILQNKTNVIWIFLSRPFSLPRRIFDLKGVGRQENLKVIHCKWGIKQTATFPLLWSYDEVARDWPTQCAIIYCKEPSFPTIHYHLEVQSNPPKNVQENQYILFLGSIGESKINQNFGTVFHTDVYLIFLRLGGKLSGTIAKFWGRSLKIQRW